ncbi:MAG: hypothetical protein RL213_2177 [Bacteroidota bacterium]
MKTEIITIGDELLIGQVVDTNSAWMGRELNAIGIRVHQITSVSDDEAHILSALREAAGRAKVVLITGGLGPTKDDRTKKTLCGYFGTTLRFDEGVYANIERLFRERGREVTPTNRAQAEVPAGCTVLPNPRGTAAGMWFEKDGIIYVSLPGVPSEMKGLMEQEVLPRLRDRFRLPPVLHRTVLTQGIGESMLSDRLEEWENALPSFIRLAYLPAQGMVRLRMTATGDDEAVLRAALQEQERRLLPLVAEYVYGFDEETLEEVTGRLLLQEGKTVGTAESCTGGYIAHRITSVPGSSAYYLGSLVPYAYEEKEKHLGIPAELLNTAGAVSEPVVRLMAENARAFLGVDYAVATSGIAGPGGATAQKPVGTVWIAVSGPGGTVSRLLQLGQGRERVIRETALYALDLLRRELQKHAAAGDARTAVRGE